MIVASIRSPRCSGIIVLTVDAQPAGALEPRRIC
jgi:hypothetical protein